jgi:hypothetical protein
MNKNLLKVLAFGFAAIAIFLSILAIKDMYNYYTSDYQNITGTVIDATCRPQSKNTDSNCSIHVSYQINRKMYDNFVNLNRETSNVKKNDPIKLRVQKKNHNNVEIRNDNNDNSWRITLLYLGCGLFAFALSYIMFSES